MQLINLIYFSSLLQNFSSKIVYSLWYLFCVANGQVRFTDITMALSKRDYEVYKSGIDKLVYKYLSRDRTAAASLITTAVDSGADKRKLAEKLTGYADKGLAHKLADKVSNTMESHLESSL